MGFRLRVGRNRLLLGDIEIEAELVIEDIEVQRFQPYRVRAAHLPTRSGWIVSLNWGDLSLSDNEVEFVTEEPALVEVGVMWNGDLVPIPGHGDVVGNVPVALVLRLVEVVGRWPPGAPQPVAFL